MFDDKPKVAAKNEIVIDDASFKGEQETLSASKAGSQETTKISPDQSRIDTMYDQFGNKTETRCFSDDLRLKCITLLTAADGKKKISAYGQNGEIKSLPADIFDKALTASANELADSAGIYQIYRQPAPVMQSLQSRNTAASLRPMPSYNFPVQNRQIEPVPTEDAHPDADAANEKSNENKTDSSASPAGKEQ